MSRVAGLQVLAIVLAGGRGSRLSPLTDERAKPAVPFLGTYRLIDFTLSNIVNSGLSDVWVVEQYLPHGLNDHLSGGRPWDLDRTRGGLVVMPPFSSPDNEDGEFSQGNAHALAQHAHLIREFGPDLVLVLSADHVYKLDYTNVIRHHIDRQASVTMVTTELPDQREATRFGNVKADANGKVTQFAYKPHEPLGKTVAAEIFVYDAKLLLQMLNELEGKGELGDYGEQLLPAFVKRGDAHAYPHRGYWKDVGTLGAYMQAHRDFLDGQAFKLHDDHWPFITASLTRPPTLIEKTARLDQSFVCGGAVIAGEVTRSVVAPNAVIEKGATVRDSIIQPGAIIRSGAHVSRAVIDHHATIGKDAQIGGKASNSIPTVIGAHASIQAGLTIKAGHYVAPRARITAHQQQGIKPIETNDRGGK